MDRFLGPASQDGLDAEVIVAYLKSLK